MQMAKSVTVKRAYSGLLSLNFVYLPILRVQPSEDTYSRTDNAKQQTIKLMKLFNVKHLSELWLKIPAIN